MEGANVAVWMRDTDIQSSITRCTDILNSGIFSMQNASNPMFEAAVTLLLIHIWDLLAKANTDKQRIDFKEDFVVTEKVFDVTELIRAARNAACHVSSGEHKLQPDVKFTFCVCFGHMPQMAIINDQVMGSDYHDDVAIFYGPTRVYLRRHIIRCLDAIRLIYPQQRPQFLAQ